ncbi:MAG TPA: PPA1309 family protein [Nakamurella sp.]|nr:PPA1309 family protein [Nakamurella sp.]
MTQPPPATPGPPLPDPLVAAVDEVEQFAAAGGWDAPRRMFALVRTADLLAAEPQLATRMRSGVDVLGEYTPIAQEDLPGDTLSDALATISWPSEVAGCALVLEILAGAGEQQAEARLAAGVLRDRPGGACVLRWRHDPDGPVLRGPDLAPGLLAALRGTFDD